MGTDPERQRSPASCTSHAQGRGIQFIPSLFCQSLCRGSTGQAPQRKALPLVQAPRDVLTLAARASRQEKLLALTCDPMIKDLKIQLLKAILKLPMGMGDTHDSGNGGGNAALPSPAHRPGELCEPTRSRAEAMAMGCRKQSSGSHHDYNQPQNPQHALPAGFIPHGEGESLTKVPHQSPSPKSPLAWVFKSLLSYSPSPLLQGEVTLHPRAPLLCLAKTPDQH